MEISPLIWTVTLVLIVGLLLFDFVFHVRKAHTPTIKEAALWSAFYVGVALLFGLGFFALGQPEMATEYYAGYVTEKALSVDNLFVFLVIMGSFNVPRQYQQKVLLFGIVFALIARSVFIFVGAGLISLWSDVFYLFGIILLMTAGQLLKKELAGDSEEEEADNFIIRFARRHLNTTEEYHGDKITTRIDGKRMFTPMLLVMIAIGGTDLLFAVDSIPAIYGLTQEPFIVFAATAFSLMGLRQLYFLIDGLLDRLIYLSYGLALILGFIGVKLMIHALHENNLFFVNNGEDVSVMEISTGLSLLVIVGVLILTVFSSLVAPKGRALRAIQNAEKYSLRYVDLVNKAPEDREFNLVKTAEQYDHWAARVQAVPERYQEELIKHRAQYLHTLEKARGLRSGAAANGEPKA
ncbi:TerC family protein [Nesterenkonia lutea]|uniref:Tellurite resistance protein TerC n=1 Tax=Nesterenkonia lutea TaxID=272919 RepID=A0ABR9JDX5_9MICC|nr:TerC family protein [Nesterenkonia lutea]MBE1524137.1 tellurite resistance protein TerC [Nesterenkonia lutea]